jgi:coenzyme Q-binding protein COQ10
MPSVTKTVVMNAEINKVYQVITDYSKYAEFMDGVSGVKVLQNSEASAKVEYSLNLIKTFSYTLSMTHNKPTKVSWIFESGDIFKRNNGSWSLKDLGDNKTEVTYDLDVDVKVFAPSPIVKALTEKNLPNLLAQVEKRAQKI